MRVFGIGNCSLDRSDRGEGGIITVDEEDNDFG